jgi:diguanylate cyclase (GGDEF)-like protein
MWRGETKVRVLRTLVILGILAGAAGAVIGAVGAVSAWRQDVKRDSVARLIADARFVSTRERGVLASVETLPTLAERRAAAASFAPLAAGQTRRIDRAAALASGDSAGRLIDAETQHARAVAIVSRAFAVGTPPATRLRLLEQAGTLVRSSDANLRTARSILPTRPWPNSFLELLEASALALVVALGLWRLVQIARGLAGLRYAIENRREVERLQDAAHTDSLTGLGNHRMFYDHLAREIKRRSRTGSTFSLLAIDLDGLKRVNDERGHLAGDEFIKTVARAVRMEVERMGSLYRTGGDEFMVLLPNRRAWSALTIAQNIQRAATDATGGRALSVGITESANTESARLLIHQADVALYEAKRNMLLAVIYRPGLERVGDGATDSAAPTANQRALAAALAHAIDAKDSGERNHCETVAELSVGIGARVGIPAASLERLRLAGLVHDVGKIGLPDVILQKPGALELDERVELEQHVTIGHAILLAADLDTEAEWVLHHHERYDGTGYPAGLAGEEIPLASRVLAVADAFETMTGGRPYRTRLSVEAALAELQEHSGGQFDPDCVTAIADLLGQSGTGAAQAYSSSGSLLT